VLKTRSTTVNLYRAKYKYTVVFTGIMILSTKLRLRIIDLDSIT
jgi:hypothetical protein